jgi:hypothetical protein
MADWRWYLSVAAVQQWMALTGRSGPAEASNPDFAAAQDELGDLSLTASLARTPEKSSGALTYRGKVTLAGRRRRVELTVIPYPRDEGRLPQLVRVSLK